MSSDFELEPLLAPLDTGAPCGPDLVDHRAFLDLETAGEAGSEIEMGRGNEAGRVVQEATGPKWGEVKELALALSKRTRDLRVAIWLTRSVAHRSGFEASVQGLKLIHGLLERHWPDVHPQPDGDDFTRRLNAFATLADTAYFIADVRSAALFSHRGKAISVRDLELALGRDKPHTGEQPMGETDCVERLQAAATESPNLPEVMRAGLITTRDIERLLIERVGSEYAPDFAPLIRIMKVVADASTLVSGEPVVNADVQVGERHSDVRSFAGRAGASTPGAINSREDVVRTLDRVCEWIEQQEPSNPAPLLIRRAQKLLSKNFIELIEDLLSSTAADDVRKLAGIASE